MTTSKNENNKTWLVIRLVLLVSVSLWAICWTTGMLIWMLVRLRGSGAPAQLPENLLITFLILGAGIPFVGYCLGFLKFKEINFFGFSMTMFEALETKIKTVQARQLFNQSVITTGRKWYWIDESGKAHELKDEETARFLSGDKGILEVPAKELDDIIVSEPPYPSVWDASVRSHRQINYFILYNKKLYYQSSHSFVFRLAVKQGVFDKDQPIEKWTFRGTTDLWAKQVSEDEILPKPE